MSVINSLRIQDFRNLAAVEIDPSAHGLNIIFGDNGSGKTSLLEAIFYLGLGRSFRSASLARLVRESTNKFSVFAQIMNDDRRLVPIGMERDTSGKSRTRVAEADIDSILELAALLPIRLINSQSHQLFESGPSFRRKYLDWGLFYQTERFLPAWRQFERALKQRNAVLRENGPISELNAWTQELVKYGLALHDLRQEYIRALTPIFLETARELLNPLDFQVSYRSGWFADESYAAVLVDNSQEDYRSGYTQLGPHRADLDITIDAIPVKYFLSRGQQKLLICAMILAQGRLLMQHTNKHLIYLVDDLPAELDRQSKQKLISLLSKQKTQVFITAIDGSVIYELIKQSTAPVEVFHVEQGRVKPTKIGCLDVGVVNE